MGNTSWRKIHRYPDYDYASAGSYFVTICLQSRAPLFGSATSSAEIVLNDAGLMIIDTWRDLPNKFPGTGLDAVIVMPDHLHGIVHLGANPGIAADVPLGTVMQWFKTITTNRYIRGVKELGWPSFDRYFWQKNYHDRILRNDIELASRRRYIETNPARWWEKRDQ